jgi:hypothetical protein
LNEATVVLVPPLFGEGGLRPGAGRDQEEIHWGGDQRSDRRSLVVGGLSNDRLCSTNRKVQQPFSGFADCFACQANGPEFFQFRAVAVK